MYQSDYLKTHMETVPTIEVGTLTYAEINMNDATNIKMIGNYRNRNGETVFATFDENDEDEKYTGYTDADIVIDGSYVDANNTPQTFSSLNEKHQLLYSLEDCFGKFRPRSGINKLAFFDDERTHFLHNVNSRMMSRPRYYISSKDDKFKYWTSFRTQANGNGIGVTERGISKTKVVDKDEYYIDDAAPFIVYNTDIPINRVIIKMQTNVGTTELKNLSDGNGNPIKDYLYDAENTIENRTVPIDWKIEYLDDSNNWTLLKQFDSDDNTTAPLIGRDGYLELKYASSSWSVATQNDGVQEKLFSDFNNPESNQFMYIRGLRIVVNTMSKVGASFDLIELSPRIAMDMSSMVLGYTINKVASDLGTSGMPVGQLLASTGSIDIADYDNVFSLNNLNSVIAPFIKKNIQFKFYEIIYGVANGTEETTDTHYIPVKVMYADTFPDINTADRTVNIRLRDLYFYLESMTAPELLIKDVSFSYAIATLLDSIGFSNYIYKKSQYDDEPIIPYFYVAPNSTVAEVLQGLAISTQTAMFFDEYNNLVLMSRSYMLAAEGERTPTDPQSEINFILRGSDGNNSELANIKNIVSKSNNVFNDGKIVYTTRYIQKDMKEIKLANFLDRDRVYVYRKALLWEVTADPKTKSKNEEVGNQEAYALTAIPLSVELSAIHPTVSGGKIINNSLDLGESVYFMPRYVGYFYSNGEIIKFDAIEYSVSQPFETGAITANSITSGQTTISLGEQSPTELGLVVGQMLSKISGSGLLGNEPIITAINETTNTITVSIAHAGSGSIEFAAGSAESSKWITSAEEYQKYFAEVPFNGKMYPTGRVRIFAEPYYNQDGTLKNGPVSKSGRAQFNTNIAKHTVGLPSWTNSNVAGVEMESNYLFNDVPKFAFTITTSSASTNSKTINIVSGDMQYVSVGQKIIGTGIPSGTKIKKKNKTSIIVSKEVTVSSGQKITVAGVKKNSSSFIQTEFGSTGKGTTTYPSNSTAQTSIRSGIFINTIGTPNGTYSELAATTSSTQKIQSSALKFTGPTPDLKSKVLPIDFVSYTYNQVDTKYSYFGTRMRILGSLENNTTTVQTPNGGMSYYSSLTTIDPSVSTTINGGGGGLAVFVDPDTNNGYFFELIALSAKDMSGYKDVTNLANMIFYKVVKKKDDTSEKKAIPMLLWSGLTQITVDTGIFAGETNIKGEANPTVFDVAVEYKELADNAGLEFHLYVNNKLVGTVTDDNPFTDRKPNIATFVRGTSSCLFENVYAMGINAASNYIDNYSTPTNGFATFAKEKTFDPSVTKYSLPEPVANYLAGISPITTRAADLYFEEFGSIMREAAHFDIKYDKAFPAFVAQILPTLNSLVGYKIGGFTPSAYGAEFLIFNTTDSVLELSENTGNFLKIGGVTFTQQAQNNYSIDEYFAEKANMSNPNVYGQIINQPQSNKITYQKIKNSRIDYGKNEFTINAEYIQSVDGASSLMSWLVQKITGQRKSIGVDIFPNPALQLGDIVTVDYKTPDGTEDALISNTTRFVIYNIEYSRNSDGPSMKVYLSEITEGVTS